eukprot:2493901-Lingulodinium_polyedra.AAC.1
MLWGADALWLRRLPLRAGLAQRLVPPEPCCGLRGQPPGRLLGVPLPWEALELDRPLPAARLR